MNLILGQEDMKPLGRDWTPKMPTLAKDLVHLRIKITGLHLGLDPFNNYLQVQSFRH